jgi:phage-related protein (TIGR01555 family)
MGRIRMAVDALRGIGADAYSDSTTGRGLGNDRAGRAQGGSPRKTDEALLNLYKSNGGMQRVVNAPADDATRKGFKIVTDDPQDNIDVQKRWTDLDLQAKFRDLVKFMQIYPQGSAFFIALLSSNLEDQRMFAMPMPKNILEIDFINSMNHPGDFTVQSSAVNDPTTREYSQVFFRIGGRAIHPSWVTWLAHEWDRRENEGISRVNSTYDAIAAQDSALWSVSTMVQQLSMMIYTSNKFTKMSLTKKEEFSSHVRNFAETGSFWGIKDDEKVDRLDYRFTGLKDILDFIFQNISLYSQIPQNILIGRAQGILTAAEEDTINYYSFINQFQKSKLERLYRVMIDLLLLEQRHDLYKRHKGKLEYEIEFLPLWELAPTLKSENEKRDAERDLIDMQSGKVKSADELRKRDPFYSMLDKEEEVEGGEEETNREDGTSQSNNPKPDKEKEPEADAFVGVSEASKGKVTKSKDHISVRFHKWEEIEMDSWKDVALDLEAGVFATKARLKGKSETIFFEIVFKGNVWDEEKALTWIDFNLPPLANSATDDGNIIGLDEIENALRRADGEWDELPTLEDPEIKRLSEKDAVETTRNQIRVRVARPGDFQKGSFRSITISKKKGISAIIGRPKGKSSTKVQSYRFDKKKWDAKTAAAWVRDKGFKPI